MRDRVSRRFALRFFACAVIPMVATPVDADDWPEWLGPERSGHSAEEGWLQDWPEKGPARLWERSIGSGYSAITVARGKLMLYHRVANENIAECLDAAEGKTIWKYSVPTDYVDRYGFDGGPRCAPQIIGSLVYLLDPDGVIHAISFDDGKPRFKRDLRSEHSLEQNFFGTGATPLVREGRIYLHIGGTEISAGSGMTFALDAESGKTIWKTPNHGGSYASPVYADIGGDPYLFVFHRGGLSALDPRDGKERWMYRRHSRTFESVNAATPIVKGDIVLFTATYGTGAVCLRVTKDGYTELWKDDMESRVKTLEVHWAPPLLIDGHVYGFSGRHSNGCSLNCVELETGDLLWKWPGFLYRGSMIFSDGHAIALGEYGELALLELTPKGHRVVERVPEMLRYPAWTVPTLANGRLYLRDLHRLICLDLRREK